MKYKVQFDATEPDKWKEIVATDAMTAIANASKPIIRKGHNPRIAYLALGIECHPNGAPICVQSYSLTVIRK